jgi:hypothetical protein
VNATVTTGGVGELLREWRSHRRMSPLRERNALLLAAGTRPCSPRPRSIPTSDGVSEGLLAPPANALRMFIRWVAHATGANGPIEVTGVDRIKVRDGKVVENRIFFDRTEFERKLGISLQ